MSNYNLVLSTEGERNREIFWDAVDEFRGETDMSHAFNLALFVLSLHKDGFTVNWYSHSKEVPIHLLLKRLLEVRHPLSEDYKRILTNLFIDEREFHSHSIVRFMRRIEVIDPSSLNQEFSHLFECLIADASTRILNSFEVPLEIISAMSAFIPHDRSLVFNPFATSAAFGVVLNRAVTYKGFERNPTLWALGKMRFLAHNLHSERYLIGDSFNEWWGQNEFSAVVSCPPFNLRNTADFPFHFNSSSFYAGFFRSALEATTPDGKIVVLVSLSFLMSANSDKKFRTHLVQNDLIDTIVQLPGNLFSNTRIPCAIVVLDKARNKSRGIRMIDATDLRTEIRRKPSKLHLDKVLELIHNENGDESLARFVPAAEIESTEFNLLPSRYLSKPETITDGFKLVPLGKVAAIIDSQRAIQGSEGFIVRIKDLNKDLHRMSLDLAELGPTVLKSQLSTLTESSLLVALRGGKLWPTWFEFKEAPIHFGNEIIALRINEALINTEYLISQLSSKRVMDQLLRLSVGTAIMSIRKSDLLNILIEVPDRPIQEALAEERRIVAQLKEARISSKDKEDILEAKIAQARQAALDDFRSMQHTMRQYLAAFDFNIRGTLTFLQKNAGQPILLDDVYSKNLNQTLGEHFDSLLSRVSDMSALLNEQDFSLLHEPASEILGLLNNFIDANQSNKFKYELFTEDYYTDGEDSSCRVKISQRTFDKLLLNVKANAEMHAFLGDSEFNILRCILAISDEYVLLEIWNNGKPLPENYDTRRFRIRGEKGAMSAGKGIGGYDIGTIMEKIGGSFELINEPTNEFPVAYQFKFPIIK